MASAAVSSNKQMKKKRPAQTETGAEDEFDNPLASSDGAAETARKDFAASGGELAEYGEGYDEKFSSSQIFQKLETEASVSPWTLPHAAPPSTPRPIH